MRIHEVFEKKISQIKKDGLVQGILLTGSLARGTETEFSDLDIIVLYPENKVVEEVIDGVPVETHYNTYAAVLSRLGEDAGFAYLFTYGKIIEDGSGILRELTRLAENRLKSYEPSDAEKAFVAHKIQALREKLYASLSLCDSLKTAYLIHNNFKLIVQFIYLENSLPVPPQGLLYEIYDCLEVKPADKWLEKLLTLEGEELAEFALICIKAR